MSTLKTLVGAAMVLSWTAIQPVAASAQTSGIGGDGKTRILFRGTDGTARILRLGVPTSGSDSKLGTVELDVTYPSYEGWTPIAIAVTGSNQTFLLWRHSGGDTSVYQLDTNLQGVVGGGYYEPHTNGWTVEGLSSAGDNLSLIFSYTRGRISVLAFKVFDDRMDRVTGAWHGPFGGFDPTAP